MNYQKLSLSTFYSKINSESKAREMLWLYRFGPTGFKCPECEHEKFYQIQTRMEVRICASCERQVRLRAGSIMHRSHLPLLTWLRAIYLMTSGKRGISALELQRHFGGSGIRKTVEVDSLSQEVSRSEQPGMLGILVDFKTTGRWKLGLEHFRGFRFGPLSSGVGFTGLNVRYYFLCDPFVTLSSRSHSYLFGGGWTPFVGLLSGIASGTIERDDILVPTVNSSGIYFGARLGLDLATQPTRLIRAEFMFAQTLFDASSNSQSLSSYGILVSILFGLF
jgi:transposase-like protein